MTNLYSEKYQNQNRLIQEVVDYYEGNGKYNFSHLPDSERGIAALEAWEEIYSRLKEVLVD